MSAFYRDPSDILSKCGDNCDLAFRNAVATCPPKDDNLPDGSPNPVDVVVYIECLKGLTSFYEPDCLDCLINIKKT